MTLIEAERLVRRLTDVLQHRAPEALARALAQDYAEACRGVAHRLEQCAAMLAQGDEAQALQLAEAPPPVLDLVTRLAFREAAEWRAYCLAANHPVADAFEGKFIRQLSEAYGKGLAPDHQLYREYREAVLRHQDARAVAALRAIVQRNPADAHAPRELERLQHRLLDATGERIATALAAGDAGRAVALVEEFESLNFPQRPAGETWQRAQQARCLAWLRAAQSARARHDWAATGTLLSALQVVRDEHALAFDAAAENALAELRGWAGECQRADTEDTKFARALLALQQMLNLSEEKQLSARAPGRRELRDDLEGIERKWREIEQFGRSVAAELTTRTRKTVALLRVQVARKDRLVRQLVVAGVALFAVLAGAASLALYAQRKAQDLGAELRHLAQARQVAAAQKLAQHIRTTEKSLAAGPALLSELERTDSFLAAERQRVSAGEDQLARLQELAAQDFTGPSPAQVAAQFKAAQQGVAALAEDWQPPLQTRLAGLEARWSEWLDQRRTLRETDFDQRLRQVQPVAATELKYERGPEAIRTTLERLEPDLRALEGLANAPLPQLRIGTPLVSQYASLQARVAALRDQLEKWDDITRRWQTPTTLEAYLESLQLLQASEFAAPEPKQLAQGVLTLNPGSATLLASLLLPNQPEAWNLFLRRPDGAWAPADIMPGERSRWNQLRDDENIHNIVLCKLTVGAFHPTNRLVFTRGLLATNRFGRKTGPLYDPGESSEARQALAFKNREVHRLELEEVGPAPEAAVFKRVGLQDLLDARGGTNYAGSLLAILDRLNQETAGSPLLRAFLALRAQELLELRPADGGAAWAPALAVDRQRLLSLGADSIRSGDWLVPARIQELAGPLEAHFVQARKVSYLQQAKFQRELARRAVSAGWVLVGHAGTNGLPAVPAPSADGAELWGWTAAGKTPALLFRYHAAERRHLTVNPALPLTPLLVFRADRRQLLAQVRQALAVPAEELGSALPPLFEVAHE
jgi:hypothetical protein